MEDVIALQGNDVTKRAESEEWLDNLRSEVEDIVDSIEEYLESCAEELPSVKGEISVVNDVVGEVDNKEIWNCLMIRKGLIQHSSSNYCQNLHSPKGTSQLLNTAIKILTRKRKESEEKELDEGQI